MSFLQRVKHCRCLNDLCHAILYISTVEQVSLEGRFNLSVDDKAIFAGIKLETTIMSCFYEHTTTINSNKAKCILFTIITSLTNLFITVQNVFNHFNTT